MKILPITAVIFALGIAISSSDLHAQTCLEVSGSSCSVPLDCQTEECPDCFVCIIDDDSGEGTCQFISQSCAYCGDGNVDENLEEECDDGVDNSNTQADACRLNCTDPICGDGVTDSGEECDGGVNCDNNCQFIETPPGNQENPDELLGIQGSGTLFSCDLNEKGSSQNNFQLLLFLTLLMAFYLLRRRLQN